MSKKILSLVALLPFIAFSQTKIAPQKLKQNQLPKEIRYDGKLADAISWQEKDGKHFAITSTTEGARAANSENDGFDYKLYAYHFVEKSGKFERIWQVYDFVSDCNVDHQLEFLPNTLNVTDLDKNGIPEIWIMYKKLCAGDVSPAEMKVIMYEGPKKHAMRGENKVVLSGQETYGGTYSFDEAFNKAPNVFRTHAQKLWKTNLLQKW